MSDRKLYALNESDVVKLANLAKGFEMVSTRLGHLEDVRLHREFIASLVPLEVHGTDLMATFENHMTVTGSGGGWVCSECGHRYSGPISKPQAWEHATIAALEALLQENES